MILSVFVSGRPNTCFPASCTKIILYSFSRFDNICSCGEVAIGKLYFKQMVKLAAVDVNVNAPEPGIYTNAKCEMRECVKCEM